jgi:hypothetical protein
VVQIHSRRPHCGVAKLVRRLPVKQEMRRFESCRHSQFVAGRKGFLGGPISRPAPVRVRPPQPENTEFGLQDLGFTLGRKKLCMLACEPQTPNPEPRKKLRVWYMGCALVRQTRETCSSHVTRSKIGDGSSEAERRSEKPEVASSKLALPTTRLWRSLEFSAPCHGADRGFKSRQPRQVYFVGHGAAWGGRLPCKENNSRVRCPGDPPKE